MKATSHEQLLDKYVGKTGTPERDVFETKLAADVQEYLFVRSRNNVLVFSQFTSFLSMAKTAIEQQATDRA